jgi:hypothetical protein
MTDRIATRSQLAAIAAELAPFGIVDAGVSAYLAGATGRPVGTPVTVAEASDILRHLEQHVTS